MRLGVFQTAHGGLDFGSRLQRLESALGGEPVDLLVCPELFVTGYNVADDLRHRAEQADGPAFRAMADLARRTETAIIYGYSELDNGAIYNAAAFVSKAGERLANHRKRLNSPNSFEEDYFSLGDTETIVEWNGARIALLICYEFEIAEGPRAAALAGADIIAVPTALVRQWRPIAERMVAMRAFENGVWMLYANHAGSENGFDYVGSSRIVAPDGVEEVVAGDGETLLAADYDAKRVAAARTRLPYLRDCARLAPHYAR